MPMLLVSDLVEGTGRYSASQDSSRHTVERVADHSDAAVGEARIYREVGAARRQPRRRILGLEGCFPVAVLNYDVAVLLDGTWLQAEALYTKIRKHVREPDAYRRGSLQRGLARRKKDALGPKEVGCGLGVSRIDGRDVLMADLIDGFFQGREGLCVRSHGALLFCSGPSLYDLSALDTRRCNQPAHRYT
jgi:hypothetical protein